MYFFFSQFNHKLHTYSRAVLDFALSMGVVVFLFVFGNIDYFPNFHSYETKRVVFGVEKSHNEFTLFSNPMEPPARVPTIYDTVMRRMNESSIANLIMLMAYGYGIYLVISFIITASRRLLKVNLIEAGIEVFAEKQKYPEIQFEDLVSKTEIICQSHLIYHNRGREIGNMKVKKMHKERLNRLRRNFKRNQMKDGKRRSVRSRRMPGGIGLGGFKGPSQEKKKNQQTFITISSYDYRVSQNKEKNAENS